MTASTLQKPTFTRAFRLAGLLLGFGLGGFFDGILLHQILQWHHLLSALEGRGFADLRVQILADGLFHAAMYAIAAIGLWLLWRARRDLQDAGADRALGARLLIGFGAWHVVDAVFSHWLLGLHRIRMETDMPLVWDVAWLAVFGLVPLALGVWLRGPGAGGTRRGRALAAALVLAVPAGGAVASLPPPGISQVVVFFRPDMAAAQVMAAAAAVEARVVWADAGGGMWVFDLGERSRARELYGHGALFVGDSLFPAGCLSWSRA